MVRRPHASGRSVIRSTRQGTSGGAGRGRSGNTDGKKRSGGNSETSDGYENWVWASRATRAGARWGGEAPSWQLCRLGAHAQGAPSPPPLQEVCCAGWQPASWQRRRRLAGVQRREHERHVLFVKAGDEGEAGGVGAQVGRGVARVVRRLAVLQGGQQPRSGGRGVSVLGWGGGDGGTERW